MTLKRPTAKSIVIAVSVLALIVGAALFVYKYKILQYSAEKIVRNYLPDYITVEKMSFDFKSSRIVFNGFKILNPPGCSRKYLLEVAEMECKYRMKGVNILSGVEVLDPVFTKPILIIERLRNRQTNLQEMSGFIQSAEASAKARKSGSPAMAIDANSAWQGAATAGIGKAIGTGGISSIVKLPEEFLIKDGGVIYLDWMISPRPYKITLDQIDATLGLKLDKSYTKALKVSTVGTGMVNGRPGEVIKWDTKLDPTATELTMSNRFNVTNVDIMAFLPYYANYSPFMIKSGHISGTLIFDFDNGNIGSTNEIRLSKFLFAVKRGYENAQFLDTAIPDLVKYFTSASGDVLFDFKIKGTMSDPQFYLGPIAKQAIASMFIDKITQALAQDTKEQANPLSAAQSTGQKTDIEKAAEYIKMFQGILKDKE